MAQNASPPPQTQTPAATSPSLVQSFVGVLVRPTAFFESVRAQTGFGPPIVFAVVMGVLAGVIQAVIAVVGLGAGVGMFAGVGAILFMPIVAVIFGSFVGGAIVHVISLIAGGKGTFEQSVRVASYSLAVMPIAALVGFIPLVSLVPNLYGLYVVALGLMAIHMADRQKTLIVAGVLAVLLVLVTVGGLFAGRAAKRAADEMQAKYGEGSELQKEMQRSAEELRKAVEAAQRAAEKQQQQPKEPGPAK